MSDTGIGGHNQKPRRSTTGVGTGDVDLSNYYTQTQLDALLGEKQDKLVGAKTFYVNGNNVNLGDGGITNPFMTIERALDKIRATGDFATGQAITDRISIVVQPYSGINYQVSQNMWGNIDWVFEEGATITNSSSLNGEALFDEYTESDDSVHIQIFGKGEFDLSNRGLFKSKSNTFQNSSVNTTDKIIQIGDVTTNDFVLDVGYTRYSGSFGSQRPTRYIFSGKPTGSRLLSSGAKPIIIYRTNGSSTYPIVQLNNFNFLDRSTNSISGTGIVEIERALWGNSIRNCRFLISVGVNNRKKLIKITQFSTLIIENVSAELSTLNKGVTFLEIDAFSNSNHLLKLNGINFNSRTSGGAVDNYPHIFIRSLKVNNYNRLELINVNSKFNNIGNITLNPTNTYFNQIGGKYRFDNLPGSGNNLELDANGNVVRGTGGGSETLTIVFGKSNFVNNNNLISPFGDPNGQLRTYPLPFDCEITDVSVQVQRTNAGETVGCEIKTVASSESGNNADTFGSDGTLIYAPSFVVTGAGTRYQPKKNFNAISGVTASAGSCLIVKAKHTGASTYGLIVVIQVKRI